jgi:hypothetical protein
MKEKIKFIMSEISKKNNETDLQEVIENSDFIFKDHWNQSTFPNAYDLQLNLSPEIFTKHNKNIIAFAAILEHRINYSSPFIIQVLKILPDYEKIVIHNSEISIVITDWEEINEFQKKLIEDIKKSNHSIDYQNIGNSARIIMDKLARIVFDPKIYKAENPGIELHNGKFKNQLNTYIIEVLNGKKNKELRQFSVTAIDFTEKAIDLMNTTTHKLDTEKHFAEVCVISTISVISLIKAIKEIELQSKTD